MQTNPGTEIYTSLFSCLSQTKDESTTSCPPPPKFSYQKEKLWCSWWEHLRLIVFLLLLLSQVKNSDGKQLTGGRKEHIRMKNGIVGQLVTIEGSITNFSSEVSSSLHTCVIIIHECLNNYSYSYYVTCISWFAPPAISLYRCCTSTVMCQTIAAAILELSFVLHRHLSQLYYSARWMIIEWQQLYDFKLNRIWIFIPASQALGMGVRHLSWSEWMWQNNFGMEPHLLVSPAEEVWHRFSLLHEGFTWHRSAGSGWLYLLYE